MSGLYDLNKMSRDELSRKVLTLGAKLTAAKKEADQYKTAWEYQGDRVIKLEAELAAKEVEMQALLAELETANNKFENYKTAALLFEEKLKAKDEIIKTLKDLWLATEKAISSGIFG